MKLLQTLLIFVIAVCIGCAHADSSQNTTIELHSIEKKMDNLDKELLAHENNSTVLGIGGINFALYGIIISLILAIFASINAIIDQSKLKKFIKSSRIYQDALNFFNTGNYENAYRYYDAYLKMKPTDIKALNNAGASLAHQGKWKDAIPYYQKILEIQQGKWNDTITYYQKILKIHQSGTDPETEKKIKSAAYNNLGLSYTELGEYDNALSSYQKSLEIENYNPDALMNIGYHYMDKIGQPQDAIKYFDMIIDKNLSEGKELAEVLTNKAKALSALKKYPETILLCDQALSIDKNNIKALIQKSISLYHLRQYGQALLCCEIILKIEPLNDATLLNMGNCLMEIGLTNPSMPQISQGAYRCFNEYLIRNPKDSKAYYNMGIFLVRYGYPQQTALAFFEESVKLDPNFLDGHFNIGTGYLLLGNNEKALPAFEKALEVSSDIDILKKIDVLTNMGICLFNLKEYQRAIFECFYEVFKIDHYSLVALKYMGDSFEKLGNIPMATLCLQIYSMLI